MSWRRNEFRVLFIKNTNHFHLRSSPRRSRSTEATPTDSSVDRRAASDWTRSRPGPPDPDRTRSTRSRWDATGPRRNLLARRKRPVCLWPARPGSRCTAGRKDESRLSKNTAFILKIMFYPPPHVLSFIIGSVHGGGGVVLMLRRILLRRPLNGCFLQSPALSGQAHLAHPQHLLFVALHEQDHGGNLQTEE